MEENKNNSNRLLTVAGAVAVGVVIGLILADKETRQKVKTVLSDLAAELGDMLSDVADNKAPDTE